MNRKISMFTLSLVALGSAVVSSNVMADRSARSNRRVAARTIIATTKNSGNIVSGGTLTNAAVPTGSGSGTTEKASKAICGAGTYLNETTATCELCDANKLPDNANWFSDPENPNKCAWECDKANGYTASEENGAKVCVNEKLVRESYVTYATAVSEATGACAGIEERMANLNFWLISSEVLNATAVTASVWGEIQAWKAKEDYQPKRTGTREDLSTNEFFLKKVGQGVADLVAREEQYGKMKLDPNEIAAAAQKPERKFTFKSEAGAAAVSPVDAKLYDGIEKLIANDGNVYKLYTGEDYILIDGAIYKKADPKYVVGTGDKIYEKGTGAGYKKYTLEGGKITGTVAPAGAAAGTYEEAKLYTGTGLIVKNSKVYESYNGEDYILIDGAICTEAPSKYVVGADGKIYEKGTGAGYKKYTLNEGGEITGEVYEPSTTKTEHTVTFEPGVKNNEGVQVYRVKIDTTYPKELEWNVHITKDTYSIVSDGALSTNEYKEIAGKARNKFIVSAGASGISTISNIVAAVQTGKTLRADMKKCNEKVEVLKNSLNVIAENLDTEVGKLPTTYDRGREIVRECGDFDLSNMDKVRGLMTSSSITSGIGTAGAVVAAVGANKMLKDEETPSKPGEKMALIGGAVSAATNTASTVTTAVALGKYWKEFKRAKNCKEAL